MGTFGELGSSTDTDALEYAAGPGDELSSWRSIAFKRRFVHTPDMMDGVRMRGPDLVAADAGGCTVYRHVTSRYRKQIAHCASGSV